MNLLTKVGSALGLVRQTEGEPRPGPWWLPVTGGWLSPSVGKYANWWQMGYDPEGGNSTAMVEACISAYAETVAMCPGDHWRLTEDGSRERITNSDLARILRKPNDYQTISEFLTWMVDALYRNGNSYAFALRNNRNEIASLHPMNPRLVVVHVSPETGELFYRMSGNRVVDELFDNLIIPSRDVLSFRLKPDMNDVLEGKSPLEPAAMDIMASGAMTQQQLTFYMNQARPGLILQTEKVLTKEQADQARAEWNRVSSGLNQGGIAIAHAGLKAVANPTMTARDSQFAELMKQSDERIALAFGIPLQIFGLGGSAPFSSTEALMTFWKARSLGFLLNHLEESIGVFFKLKGQPDEYLEFNTGALLRSSESERISALKASIDGGIRTINEARAEIELGKVEGGDQIRVQQQDVPLDWHEKQEAAKAEAAKAAAAAIASRPPSQPAQPSSQGNANGNERLRTSFRASHARNIAA